MSYLEVAKIHPKLGKILEKDAKISAKVAEEFAANHGVSVDDITNLKVSPPLLLHMHRYIDKIVALEENNCIPNNIEFKRFNAGNVESEWVYTPDTDEQKILFHLFGGGYIMGNLDTRRWIASLYMRGTNLRCLNVGYRLAPEHPYPAALEDSITVYKWLLTQDFDPQNIIICGESAGGGLAMATMLKIRELELPMPAAAVMISPWVDLEGIGRSLRTNYKYEPTVAEGSKLMAVLYAGKKGKNDPYISPIYAELEGLPPLLFQAGGIEVIRDEVVSCAEQAKTSGVDVTLEVYEGMTHVFQRYANKLDESMDAWKSIRNFVKKHIA
ncbi:MAG: alpha/beta hydrolase [Candidatus Lokiarchaeota archaeon]|nr:alpha/beta hydrolase [Candidatus Lokiarchaeota archaeon]